MNDRLVQAINNKQIISFDYDGYPRIVEPHTFGSHKDTGNDVVRGFQTGGGSKAGGIPAWRLFSPLKC